MSTSVLRLLCRHKKSDASATYHMHALYLRPAVPLRCSLRNGHLVPNGGSIIRARERRGVRLSGVRTVHTGPLAKSPIIQRTLTLFPLALGTFRRIFFNLTRPAPHLKSIKPKAKRLCLPLLCRDARARGSSSFIKWSTSASRTTSASTSVPRVARVSRVPRSATISSPTIRPARAPLPWSRHAPPLPADARAHLTFPPPRVRAASRVPFVPPLLPHESCWRVAPVKGTAHSVPRLRESHGRSPSASRVQASSSQSRE